jgi:hypothetical protein
VVLFVAEGVSLRQRGVTCSCASRVAT